TNRLYRETCHGALDPGDPVDLVHHQPPDVARVGGLDRDDDIVGTGDCICRTHTGQAAERPNDRPNLACLRLDEHIGPGLHGGTSMSKLLDGTRRTAPSRL